MAVADVPEPGPQGPPTTLVLVIGGPIEPAGVRSLCERARTLAHGLDAELIVCDLGQSGATAGTVDVIGRLQLLAKSHGRRVRFVQAAPELGVLFRLLGLEDIVDLEGDLSIQSQR